MPGGLIEFLVREVHELNLSFADSIQDRKKIIFIVVWFSVGKFGIPGGKRAVFGIRVDCVEFDARVTEPRHQTFF
jgi:hypothetical protein